MVCHGITVGMLWYHALWDAMAFLVWYAWYYSGHTVVSCSVVFHGIFSVVCHGITQHGLPWYYTMWYVIGITQCYTCWCAMEVWHNIVLHGIQYYITQYMVLHSVVCYCIMQ